MDKLNALKYFCSAAETLQFRETALRLSVSPQVVTRVIAELEQHLGAQLFTRNTRNIHLTEFGAAFLPRAQQLLADSENLFSATKEKDEIRGIVRIPYRSGVITAAYSPACWKNAPTIPNFISIGAATTPNLTRWKTNSTSASASAHRRKI